MKLLLTQFREHSPHLPGIPSEDGNNEILASGGVRATIRTRRSSVLSTRVTKPFAKRRSTAILIEPGVRWTIGPIVLKSPSYARLCGSPLGVYQRFCTEHEDACLRAGGYGGKWPNTGSEIQFGKASQPSDLSGNGSPRWRQRAFYDFVKNLSPLLVGVTLARVSVWDTGLECRRKRTVKNVLNSPPTLAEPRSRPSSNNEQSVNNNVLYRNLFSIAHPVPTSSSAQ